jgi:hypothetical protein
MILFVVAWEFMKVSILNVCVVPQLNWLFQLRRSHFAVPTLFAEEASVQRGARIFVLTLDLKLDADDDEMAEVVRNNLVLKDVTYVFIIPDDPALEKRRVDFLARHKQGKLLVVGTNRGSIQTTASNNIMIIREEGSPETGYLQIPEASGEWWAKMSEDATKIYRKNFDEILHPISSAFTLRRNPNHGLTIYHGEPNLLWE